MSQAAQAYNIRFVAPVETEPVAAKGKDLSDAACTLLLANLGKALFVNPEDAQSTTGEITYFAKMEVDGEVFVARCFSGGIGRKGGVKPKPNPLQCKSLAEVEERLGLSPGYLDCDWDGEESMEDAINRQWHGVKP